MGIIPSNRSSQAILLCLDSIEAAGDQSVPSSLAPYPPCLAFMLALPLEIPSMELGLDAQGLTYYARQAAKGPCIFARLDAWEPRIYARHRA